MIEWLSAIGTLILFIVVLVKEFKALAPKEEEGGEPENESE